MHKEVFAKKWRIRTFAEPLLFLPYGFFGIYLYENGFDWIIASLGVALFVIIPAIIIALWDKL